MTDIDRPSRQPGPTRRAVTAWLAEPAGKAALLLATGAILTITLVVAGVHPVLRMDQAVAQRLHAAALQYPGLTHTSRIVTDWVVDPWTMRLLLAAAVVWLWHRRQRLLALWVACASAAEWALRSVLRWAIGRDRPEWDRPVDSADFAAMPSGHAMTAAATCVLLLWLARIAQLPTALVRIGVTTAAVIIVAACFTRAFLGVHWLTDTLAGALLGAAMAAGATATWRTAGPNSHAARASSSLLSDDPSRSLPQQPSGRRRKSTSQTDV
ncbi:phosphatase PAP2 family protein [Streptomyces microflavus]|uniref:phosphatase PAP2 family protein n=2 Tax=Streptomyces TaxID=1883 RepID=UPI00167DFC1A|nr:phosphatase PAP2 family protein [Streptomyces microflavus]MDX2977328.1 phosphatase PAP2 family protein [Streptomyces sp. NRRL_B-2249]